MAGNLWSGWNLPRRTLDAHQSPPHTRTLTKAMADRSQPRTVAWIMPFAASVVVVITSLFLFAEWRLPKD